MFRYKLSVSKFIFLSTISCFLSCFLFLFLVFFFCVCCCCCSYLVFNRDLRQPLSQIRVSLAVALGAGQVIFLSGINATEKKVGGFFHCFALHWFFSLILKTLWSNKALKWQKILVFSLRICAGSVCHSSSYYAVFSDGRFLLDARRGNLSLSVCCKSL